MNDTPQERIYYVGAWIGKLDSALLGSPDKRLHITLAYSRTWFPYKADVFSYPFFLHPPFTPDNFGGQPVIWFLDNSILRRFVELQSAGAGRNYPTFHPHISVPTHLIDLSSIRYILVAHEYYETWEQPRRVPR